MVLLSSITRTLKVGAVILKGLGSSTHMEGQDMQIPHPECDIRFAPFRSLLCGHHIRGMSSS